MRTLQPRASRGMRQVTTGLRSLDDEVFDAIAELTKVRCSTS